MADRSATITLRIEDEIKTAFERVAEDLDQTTSQLLRAYIRHAIQQHAAKHAQRELDLPTAPPKQTTTKAKKGQRMAAACAANVRKP